MKYGFLSKKVSTAIIQNMKFAREDILKMDEANLRLQVLKPLFEKMGWAMSKKFLNSQSNLAQ